MNFRITSIILSLLFISSVSNSFPTNPDSTLIFKGINTKIAYTKGRQLNEASYIIINKSNVKVKVIINKAELIRGQSSNELNGLLIKDNQFPQGNSYIYINSGVEKKVRIKFDPFILYEGSTYTIRATILADGKEYVANSKIELFRQAYSDKNKYKK